ncbi:hypothetical protein ACU686_23790 [Yinghuangia aomiensis]
MYQRSEIGVVVLPGEAALRLARHGADRPRRRRSADLPKPVAAAAVLPATRPTSSVPGAGGRPRGSRPSAAALAGVLLAGGISFGKPEFRDNRPAPDNTWGKVWADGLIVSPAQSELMAMQRRKLLGNGKFTMVVLRASRHRVAERAGHHAGRGAQPPARHAGEVRRRHAASSLLREAGCPQSPRPDALRRAELGREPRGLQPHQPGTAADRLVRPRRGCVRLVRAAAQNPCHA